MGMHFQYDLKDDVYIIHLQVSGKIVSILVTETGIKYEVRYFDNAKVQSVYFYDDEIRNLKPSDK